MQGAVSTDAVVTDFMGSREPGATWRATTVATPPTLSEGWATDVDASGARDPAQGHADLDLGTHRQPVLRRAQGQVQGPDVAAPAGLHLLVEHQRADPGQLDAGVGGDTDRYRVA